ncbi:MAG: methyltransferase domain-containing protein [Flavobacteriaceae bacterium]
MELGKSFWEDRYSQNATGWDLGSVSPPLMGYIDQLKSKNLSILIPGAGNGYEAQYLFQQGFANVDVVDLAIQPLENIQKRVPVFPSGQLIQADFFDLEKKYDLILEQTFFCALDPVLRPAYAKKMHTLLKPEGKLAGLLFDFPLRDDGPPFGGSQEEYRRYFEPYFHLNTFERCYNSVPPRMDNELFIIFEKK